MVTLTVKVIDNISKMSDYTIIPGRLIYCKKERMCFYDSMSGHRIQTNDVIYISDNERLELLLKITDRLYISSDTEAIYRWTGLSWKQVTNDHEVKDLLGDYEDITPVELTVMGNKVSPTVLTSCIYNESGESLDEILNETVMSNRTHIRVQSVTARENKQRIFNIPFPFSNYLESGNNFIAIIGMNWVDPIRYTVQNGNLVFNEKDDGVAIGRKLSFIFIYNVSDPNSLDTNTIEGSWLTKQSIDMDKLSVPVQQLIMSGGIDNRFIINDSDEDYGSNEWLIRLKNALLNGNSVMVSNSSGIYYNYSIVTAFDFTDNVSGYDELRIYYHTFDRDTGALVSNFLEFEIPEE